MTIERETHPGTPIAETVRKFLRSRTYKFKKAVKDGCSQNPEAWYEDILSDVFWEHFGADKVGQLLRDLASEVSEAAPLREESAVVGILRRLGDFFDRADNYYSEAVTERENGEVEVAQTRGNS